MGFVLNLSAGGYFSLSRGNLLSPYPGGLSRDSDALLMPWGLRIGWHSSLSSLLSREIWS